MFKSGLFWRCVIAVCFVTTTAAATVPGLISYQGQLTTSDGEPWADGVYDLTFSLFSSTEGGSALWTEVHPGVPTTKGLFSLILGSISPLDQTVFAGDEVYLQVSVGADLVLPRTRITSQVYAQRVATVDGAKGGTISVPLTLVPESVLNDPEKGTLAARPVAMIQMTVEDDDPSISLWEPVDSKGTLAEGSVKKIELRRNGIIVFGATENDTNLVMTPDGDIVGVGQITMGENSSSAAETSVLGFRNTAEGDSSSIGGGSGNTTGGTLAAIGGGHGNVANGEGSTIGGGAFHNNDGLYGTIGGGYGNTVSGAYATIPGGNDNTAAGNNSFAFGHRARALHDGSIVWADETDADFSSTADGQFIIRASGGVGIGTDSPLGQFDVAGPPGNQSVNLPDDAISALEVLDEPGLAGSQSGAEFSLTQSSAVVDQIAGTTITTPADGYILVRGIATFGSWGTTGINQAYFQIDDTPGGGLADPFYVLVGAGDHANTVKKQYFNVAVERIFAKPAGTHTFYLEGLANSTNSSGAVGKAQRPYLSAIFIPSAYGVVATGQ